MRERINGLFESPFADYARHDNDIYSDILSAVLISHQRRLGIPPCYLRSRMSHLRTRSAIRSAS